MGGGGWIYSTVIVMYGTLHGRPCHRAPTEQKGLCKSSKKKVCQIDYTWLWMNKKWRHLSEVHHEYVMTPCKCKSAGFIIKESRTTFPCYFYCCQTLKNQILVVYCAEGNLMIAFTKISQMLRTELFIKSFLTPQNLLPIKG